MHSLNTLNRLNAEAHAAAINRVRAKGKYVVANYAGLALMSFRSFDSFSEALCHADTPLEASEHRSILGPIVSPSGRDQSEDRAQPYSLEELAALGARSVGDPEIS